jgi:hypothetical protein
MHKTNEVNRVRNWRLRVKLQEHNKVKEKTHEHEHELKNSQDIHVPDTAIIEMNEAETGVQHVNVTKQTCEPNKAQNSEANTAFNSRTT